MNIHSVSLWLAYFLQNGVGQEKRINLNVRFTSKKEGYMKSLKFILFILLVTLSFAQEKEGASTSASMGSVTMDGKIYNQFSFLVFLFIN